mmetsp:Transcript_29065/g.34273  ORF Transcript_29065/g.34273 Transcript_29065/m.34273 type:complete len:200 (+) Transcript_29065:51-650(+)
MSVILLLVLAWCQIGLAFTNNFPPFLSRFSKYTNELNSRASFGMLPPVSSSSISNRHRLSSLFASSDDKDVDGYVATSTNLWSSIVNRCSRVLNSVVQKIKDKQESNLQNKLNKFISYRCNSCGNVIYPAPGRHKLLMKLLSKCSSCGALNNFTKLDEMDSAKREFMETCLNSNSDQEMTIKQSLERDLDIYMKTGKVS